MKAISLIQPWAWLVTAGSKRIENRTWHLPPSMVGQTVLIHASKTDPRKFPDVHLFMKYIGISEEIPPEAFSMRGGVVGWATIQGCLCPGSTTLPEGYDTRWWMSDQHGFLLEKVGVLPYTQCKGGLGFFELDLHFDEVPLPRPAPAPPQLKLW